MKMLPEKKFFKNNKIKTIVGSGKSVYDKNRK